MRKLRIGITIGDINGIGLEVILKTLSHQTILDKFVPVIYGSSKIVSYHKNIIKTRDLPIANLNSIDQLADDKINIINCWNENVSINLGTPTNESGKYAYISLDRPTEDVINRRVDGLVTAPINKAAMQLADFPFKGTNKCMAKNVYTQIEKIRFPRTSKHSCAHFFCTDYHKNSASISSESLTNCMEWLFAFSPKVVIIVKKSVLLVPVSSRKTEILLRRLSA